MAPIKTCPQAILPSLIDKANSDSGVNVEGVFNGLWLSSQKIANALGPLIFASILGFYGFKESRVGLQIQPAAASAAMELFMTVLPGFFFFNCHPRVSVSP